MERKESESNAHRPLPGLLRFQRSRHTTWLSFLETVVARKRGDSNAHEPHDPYLFSRQAPHPAGSLPWRKGWDSHPQRVSTRARGAAGVLIWPVPFRGALGGSRTHDLVRTKDVLSLLSYKGMPRRHDSNVRPPPSDDVALIR